MAKKYYLNDHGLVTYNELIKRKISELVSFDVSILDELPDTGIEHILYLVPSKSELEKNIRDEYLWVDEKWEIIGSTAIDLDNYYTKDEVDLSLAEKQDILQGSSTIDISNNIISALGYTYDQEEGSFVVGDSSKNILEVLNTGEVYIKGIGNYDGTTTENASTLQQVIDSSVWHYVGDWNMFNPDYRVYKFFYYNTYNHEKIENEYTSKFANVYDIDTSKYCLVSKQYFTNVGHNAFKDCHTLNYVEIPQLVKEIKENAFSGCTALLPLTLSDKLESVTNYSLYDVPNVIYAGELDTSEWGAKAINGYVEDMFVYYDDTKTQLEACSSEANGDIIIPDGVDVINDRAFSYCIDVSTIYIPHSLEILGDDVFEGCNNINGLIYNGNIDEWNEVEKYEYWFLKSSIEYVKCNDGDIYLYEHATELYLDSGEKVRTFTNSLDYDHMQYFIDRMEQCYIGDYVTDIYENTFSNWHRTDVLYYKGTMSQWQDIRKWGCWYNNSNISIVRCSDGDIDLYDIYGTKLYNSNGDIIQRFLSTEINRDMIEPYRSNIAHCKIGYFVNTINEYAFADCSNMTEIELSDYVENIKQYAFNDCHNLTSITIPISVKYIENDIINSCYNLTEFNYAGEKNQWYLVEKNSNWFNGSRLDEYDYSYIHCSNGDIDLATVYYYNDDSSTRDLTKYLNNNYSYESLVKCEVGDAVINIDWYSFDNCYNLTEFSFTNQIESVGGYVFNNCSNLTEIVFYGSEEQWNNFNKSDEFLVNSKIEVAHCLDKDLIFTKLYLDNDEIVMIYKSGESLEQQYIDPYRGRIIKVEIGSNITSIGSYAFAYCSGLTSVTIPNSVTNIGNGAFSGCSGLTSINIPDSVISIGYSAFDGCSSLTSITIPDSVTSIGEGTFNGCSGLTSIDIPDSVTSISYGIFYGCSNLTSIDIPDSVTSIGDQAFDYCGSENNPLQITFESETPVRLVNDYGGIIYIFGNKNEHQLYLEIIVPSGYENIYAAYDSGWEQYAEFIANPNISVFYYTDDGKTTSEDIEITSNSYDKQRTLVRAKLGRSVTNIGTQAFQNCSSLTSITIPDSVAGIGVQSFYGCSSLTSVTIPDSVTSIGYQAFRGCYNLSLIDIPDSVTSIGDHAFQNCSSLTSITVDPNNQVYDSRNNCNAIIETSSNTLLVGCQNTVIPDSVTSIGYGAFGGCTGLTSIDIPDSVTSIGDQAFVSCIGLTSITIGNSVTSIGDHAFSRCSNLTSVTIPDSVTSIGYNAFYGCSGLTSIISRNTTPLIIQSNTFAGVDKSIPVYVPANSVSIYQSNIYWGQFTNIQAIPTIFYYSDGTTSTTSDTILTQSSRDTSKTLVRAELNDLVTSISTDAFYNCSGLTLITIPDSVTSIGDYAFNGCTGLTSIDIPDSVTSIGDQAFYGCSNLTSINIPDSVTNIGSSAFSYCSGLTSITIPDSVTSIGNWTFYSCSGLTSINIPDSVTSIGDYAFQSCSGLTLVTIPDSVTSIGEGTFNGCSGLTSITVNPNNQVYDSRNNCNAIIETSSNTLIVGCQNTVILDSVSSIGGSAFNGCSGLTSIDIPDSVTSIGISAFQSCSGLTSINIPDSVTSIGDNAFSWCSSLTSVTIPNSVTSISYGVFYNCSNLTSVTIPNSVTSIGGQAFYGCSNLTSINYLGTKLEWNNIQFNYWSLYNTTIYIIHCSDKDILATILYLSDGSNIGLGININTISSGDIQQYLNSLVKCEIGNNIISIGDYTFGSCSSLTSVTIPDSVTSIGSNIFNDCASLTSITVDSNNQVYDSRNNCNAIIETSSNTLIVGCQTTIIPDSVTSIGNSAFAVCSSLTSVTIPNSVTSIGDSAFINCSNLTSATIGNSVSSIGDTAFYGCSSLTSVTIGNSVTNIGNHAFYHCSSLTSINIPDSVISIDYNAFGGCSGLTSVTIGNSVTNIGSSAFNGCSNLTSINIPDSVTSVGSEAFYNCSSLTSATIGNSVTGIGSYTFQKCSSLTSATIGNSVTNIGTGAFSWCSNLTSIDIPDSVTSIGGGAFGNCSSLTSVTIGNSVTTISGNAFQNCSSLTSINIPDSVTSIGNGAFQNCSSLTSITVDPNNQVYDSRNNCNAIIETSSNILIVGCQNTVIPDSITSISNQAFYNCSNLTSVTIPDLVTSIGEQVFYNCSRLASINIPDSVTSIGNQAFRGCSSLTSIIVNSNIIINKNYTESSNIKEIFGTQVTEYIIGNSVTGIGKYAFGSCSNLTSVTIPDSVTSIGEGAFYSCSSLPSINIPDSVTSIGSEAFTNCSSLTSINIPNSVTSISSYTFSSCSSLTSIDIQDSVTSIGDRAFSGCSGLTSINIPDSVINIGHNAFRNCSGLTSITSRNTTPPTIYSDTFNNITKSIPVYVPVESVSTYQSTNYWNAFTNIQAISE